MLKKFRIHLILLKWNGEIAIKNCEYGKIHRAIKNIICGAILFNCKRALVSVEKNAFSVKSEDFILIQEILIISLSIQNVFHQIRSLGTSDQLCSKCLQNIQRTNHQNWYMQTEPGGKKVMIITLNFLSVLGKLIPLKFDQWRPLWFIGQWRIKTLPNLICLTEWITGARVCGDRPMKAFQMFCPEAELYPKLDHTWDFKWS